MSGMRTTNWDAVITSAPLNKQAAMMRDGRSTAEVKVENSYVEQPTVRDFRDFHGSAEQDLRGKRFGQLSVIGLADRKSAWVSKCDCGKYAIHTSKGLKSLAASNRAYCGECDYVRRVQSGELPSDAERVILRVEKQARVSAAADLDAVTHPQFDALLLQLGDDPKTLLSSVSRWMQRRLRALDGDDPSTDQHREDDV